jgi:NAD-specific glutamate dehydrogenase
VLGVPAIVYVAYDKREKLLQSMTDEVGELVLEDNYDQTGAIYQVSYAK